MEKILQVTWMPPLCQNNPELFNTLFPTTGNTKVITAHSPDEIKANPYLHISRGSTSQLQESLADNRNYNFFNGDAGVN